MVGVVVDDELTAQSWLLQHSLGLSEASSKGVGNGACESCQCVREHSLCDVGRSVDHLEMGTRDHGALKGLELFGEITPELGVWHLFEVWNGQTMRESYRSKGQYQAV